MATFDAGTIEGRLVLDRTAFSIGMAAARAEAEAFEARTYEARLSADSGGALAEIGAIRAALTGLNDETVNIDVSANTGGLRGLRNEMDGFSRSIHTASGRSRLLFDAIALLGPALVPVLAGATAGVAALGSSIASAGGGLGIFGAAAIGNLQQVTALVEQETEAREALAAADNATERAAAQQALNAALAAQAGPIGETIAAYDSLRTAFAGFTQATSSTVLPIFTQGMQILAGVLPALVPVVQAVGGAISRLLDRLQAFTEGGNFDAMLAFFAGPGATSIEQFGVIIGNLAVGFGHLLAAFAPFAQQFLAGLIRMTAAFSAWSQSLSGSNGFNSFISYVTTVGPQLISVLGNIVQAFIQIGKGLAPLAPLVLTVVGGFASFLSAVPPDVFTVIAGGIMAVVAAMRAWAIIQTVINILLTANPIGLLVVAIGALVAAIVLAWRNSETFRNVVLGAWNAVQAGVSAVVAWFTGTLVPSLQTAYEQLKSGIAAVGAFFVGAWNGIKAAASGVAAFFVSVGQQIAAVWAAIVGAVQTAWSAVANAVSTAMSAIGAVISAGVNLWLGFARGALNLLLGVFQAVWGQIGGVVTAAINLVRAVINLVLVTIVGIWRAQWSAALTIAQAVWNGIKAVITAAINGVRIVVTTVVNAIRAYISAVWHVIRATTSSVWNAIRAVVSGAANATRAVVTAVFNAIRSYISAVWSSVRSLTSSTWSSIRGVVSAMVSSVLGVIRSVLGQASGVVSSAWGAVKGVTSSAWEGIKSAVSNAIDSVISTLQGLAGRATSAVGNLGSTLFSAGAALIQGLINGVESKISAVTSAVSRVASAIKDFLPGSPVKRGPLRSWNNGGAGIRLAQMLASGLNRGTTEVAMASRNLAAAVQTPSASQSTYAYGGGPGGSVATAPIGRNLTVEIHNMQVRDRLTERGLLAALVELETVYGV